MTINREETLADMAATVDYLAALVEEADALDFETATDLRDAALRVKKVTSDLISFLEGGMLRQLEAGSRDYGRRTWVRRKKYAERHDHAALAAEVRQRATWRGEDAAGAVAEAVRMMSDLYLSASTKAKVTVIDRMGLDRGSVISREHTGFELQVVEHDEADE